MRLSAKKTSPTNLITAASRARLLPGQRAARPPRTRPVHHPVGGGVAATVRGC